MIVDLDAEKAGEFEEVNDSIEKYWMRFFLLLYRVNFRNNLVKIGEQKSGIPNTEVKELILTFEDRIDFEVEKVPHYCSIHFLWFATAISSEDDTFEEREAKIWSAYSGYIERTKQAARNLDIPVDKYFEKYEIELKLKAKLISVLNE